MFDWDIASYIACRPPPGRRRTAIILCKKWAVQETEGSEMGSENARYNTHVISDKWLMIGDS